MKIDLLSKSVKFFDLKSSVKAKCINTESLDPPRGWLVDEKTSALYSKNLEIAPKEQLSDEKVGQPSACKPRRY